MIVQEFYLVECDEGMKIFVHFFRISIEFNFFKIHCINKKMFDTFFAFITDCVTPNLVRQSN